MDAPVTTDAASDLRLGADFAEVTYDQWRAAVDKVLARGVDEPTPEQLDRRFERDLVTRTVDGLTIQPLYTDLGDAPPPGVAGSAPFTRGTAPLAHREFGWDVRQRVVAVSDPDQVATRSLSELERGATSLLLDLTAVEHVDVGYLDAALAGVLLDLAPVALSASDQVEAAESFVDLLDHRSVDVAASGSLGLDPIGRWAASGSGDVDAALAAAVQVATRVATDRPQLRAMVVDATVVHEAGGGDVDELAYATAVGVAVVRAMHSAGLSIDAAFEQVEFRFAASPDQFLTIAKLRAARRIWQRVAEVSGATGEAQRQRQHAMSSVAASSRYDVSVNLLRNTVECFGAGVGGADAVTILPHDDLVEPGGSELGLRMARNTQLVLIEESHLSAVVDIAGGSWYVEQLTDQIAKAAWASMQQIEQEGGIVESIRSGSFQNRVDAVRARRDVAIASRRMALTGVTEFPDITEPVRTRPAGSGSPQADATDPTFEPLRRRRYADPIEAQRARADELVATQGRPTIFLAAVGSTATNAARVGFAKNLFEVGGIQTIVSDSLDDPAELRAAFEASGARLVCICASDATYAELAVAVAEEIGRAGPDRMYLAGRPRGMDDELAAAGIDEQIVAGGDVLSVIRTALDTIGAN